VKEKDTDYYALLGLQHERFMATEAQLKQGEMQQAGRQAAAFNRRFLCKRSSSSSSSSRRQGQPQRGATSA
jgi:hypothetical protein